MNLPRSDGALASNLSSYSVNVLHHIGFCIEALQHESQNAGELHREYLRIALSEAEERGRDGAGTIPSNGVVTGVETG